MKKDILVVTPTLGSRKTLINTYHCVGKVYPERVHHIITGPESSENQIKKLVPNAEFVPEKRNEGVFSAVNDILKSRASSYKYITYINDDDYWLPGFSSLVRLLDMSPKADLAYGRTMWINEKGKIIGHVTHFPFTRSFHKLLAHGIPMFTQQSVLMRSNLYTSLNGFNESYKLVADSDFFARASILEKKFVYTNNFCAAYRKHSDQLSSNHELSFSESSNLIQTLCLEKTLSSLALKYLFRIYNIKTYLSR